MRLPKHQELYYYSDYCKWDDGERYELIDGNVYNMTPAPLRKHQELVGELFRQFSNYLRNKKCNVYIAPFDVRLPDSNEKDDDIKTVVQPDIAVICDIDKLDDRGCRGAPDLIVEVISPSTAIKDMKVKFSLYERHKVKEYWIINSEEKILMRYKLAGRKYGRPEIFSDNENICPYLFKDLKIDLSLLFN